jgi:hypothetical protein
MTKKRTLAASLFGMPQAVVETALEQLTPEQREAITPTQAGELLQVALNFTNAVGRILEGPVPKQARAGEDLQRIPTRG